MPNAPFRLGYTSLTWGPKPAIEPMLAAIAEHGWEGVEFIGQSLDWLGTPRRLRALVDRYGLVPVAMFGSVGIEPGREGWESVEQQKRLIEYAAELGCSVYPFLGGKRVYRRLPTDDEFKLLAERASELAEYAEQHGLVAAYHAHPLMTVETEEEQDRFLAFASPKVKLCLDFSIALVMREDPVAQVHKYRDRLAYVHIKDWARGKFCELGKGTLGLDVAACLGALKEVGYSGWMMTELSLYGDANEVEACRWNRQYLRQLGY